MIEFGIFRRLFFDSIRVQLDWDLLGEPEVDALVARRTEELDGWYTPWYRNEQGPCAWDDPGAEPISVTDPELQLLEPVATLAEQMRAQRSPIVQVLAATYRVPGGQLVLDGNHRLAAAVNCEKQISVLALSVHGPLDRAVLPDLGPFA